ncbi:MAG: hypothetical protein ACKO3T_27610 [Planctomycetaceae bacterium]
MLRWNFFFTLLLSLFLGCTPGIRVIKNPGDDDKGVRYYRPKPYLMVTSAQITKETSGVKTTETDPRSVIIEVKYLPDFSEEYSINTTPGLGSANVKLTLTEGWNLTEVNQDLDSKVQETLQAAATLAGAVAPLTDKSVCAASDVPLGLYESVIERDRSGRKQLVGWRYVGFFPCGAPMVRSKSGGGASVDTASAPDLYGLVWDTNGQKMTFKKLEDLKRLTSQSDSAGHLRVALEQSYLQSANGPTSRIVCIDVDSASQQVIVVIETTDAEEAVLGRVTHCIHESVSSLNSYELCLKIVRPVVRESNLEGAGQASL